MVDKVVTSIVEKGMPVKTFKSYMEGCLTDISNISTRMNDIQAQGGWDAYWRAAKNIREIASHVDLMGSVLQQSLELSLLIMNGAINIKRDYSDIMAILDEYNDQYADQVEVVEALVRFRKLVDDLKSRDEILDSVVEEVNNHGDNIDDIIRHNSNADHSIKCLRESLENFANDMMSKNAEHIKALEGITNNLRVYQSKWETKHNEVERQIDNLRTSSNDNLKSIDQSYNDRINSLKTTLCKESEDYQFKIASEIVANCKAQQEQFKNDFREKYDKSIQIHKIVLSVLAIFSIIMLVMYFVA